MPPSVYRRVIYRVTQFYKNRAGVIANTAVTTDTHADKQACGFTTAPITTTTANRLRHNARRVITPGFYVSAVPDSDVSRGAAAAAACADSDRASGGAASAATAAYRLCQDTVRSVLVSCNRPGIADNHVIRNATVAARAALGKYSECVATCTPAAANALSQYALRSRAG
jgi:hypothetical protein